MYRKDNNPPVTNSTCSIAEARYRWWVLKVKPKQEKLLAFDLMRRNIDYYLPLYTKVTKRKDNGKPRKSIVPLFKGYLCVNADKPTECYLSNRVVNIIEVRNQTRFVKELEQIGRILSEGVSIEPYAGNCRLGTKVKIESGPMQGVQGVVEKANGTARIVLSVGELGMTSVVIDPRLVRSVKEAA